MRVKVDKIGSAASSLGIVQEANTTPRHNFAVSGDVVVVRALSESVEYGSLELPTGRLAKINRNDILVGVLGKRRALKGFVGDIPDTVCAGDRLHLLNMGGVIGICTGHHSAFDDAIEVEVLGTVCDEEGAVVNISDNALPLAEKLVRSAPIVLVAGTCMNSGKTVAATEIIRQATNAGLRVAGAKLSGIACLRDTLNMQDHGAIATASFLDCGIPSTVEHGKLPAVAKTVLNHLNKVSPDLIVAELGDGILGGYAVESVMTDDEIRSAISTLVFCASDFVGVVGGMTVLRRLGHEIDLIAGSVTDSQMGEDYVRANFGVQAANAKRDGRKLFELIVANLYAKLPVYA
ncbi:MAG TPA: hypothetical protein PKD26_11720 [Pyrinomonadaceae bacterium]|nr:hypothetical protein [Pyrinomonadaceae bacterium]